MVPGGEIEKARHKCCEEAQDKLGSSAGVPVKKELRHPAALDGMQAEAEVELVPGAVVVAAAGEPETPPLRWRLAGGVPNLGHIT
jgi:hypothetical protein